MVLFGEVYCVVSVFLSEMYEVADDFGCVLFSVLLVMFIRLLW